MTWHAGASTGSPIAVTAVPQPSTRLRPPGVPRRFPHDPHQYNKAGPQTTACDRPCPRGQASYVWCDTYPTSRPALNPRPQLPLARPAAWQTPRGTLSLSPVRAAFVCLSQPLRAPRPQRQSSIPQAPCRIADAGGRWRLRRQSSLTFMVAFFCLTAKPRSFTGVLCGCGSLRNLDACRRISSVIGHHREREVRLPPRIRLPGA